MPVKCVSCKRNFKNLHALKSHQPKCRGQTTEGSGKQNISGRKLAQRMDLTEEEIIQERQVLRDQDGSEPVRKPKTRHKVNFLI